MSPSPEDPTSSKNPNKDEAADLAQAYRDIIRGEQAAAALEANLTNLERRLDAMLAAIETPGNAKGTVDGKPPGDKQQPGNANGDEKKL